MSHFGHYLLKRGTLAREDLEEGLQAQVVCGGRIGTNLLELGFVSLDELARSLADYTGVPLAPPRGLIDPAAQALKALPVGLCRRLVMLPFDIGADQIHVAMLDPRDAGQLAQIADAARREVRAFAVPEVLLRALLQRHLGLRLDPRFARLAESLRERPAQPAEAEPAAPDEQPPPAEDESPAPVPLAEGEELIDEDSFARLHENLLLRGTSASAADGAGAGALVIETPAEPVAPASAPAPPAAPGEIARLEAELEITTDRDEIGRLALRIARAYAHSAALFLVQGELLVGHCGADDELARRIQGVVVPLDSECALAEVARSGEIFRGAPSGDGVDALVAAALQRSDARELLLLPIAIRERVVNVLYTDNGPDPCGQTSQAALGALCAAVAGAYERLILAAKRAESLDD